MKSSSCEATMLPNVHVKTFSELWTAITLYLIYFAMPHSPRKSACNWKTEGSIEKPIASLRRALNGLHDDINNLIFHICSTWSLFLERVTYSVLTDTLLYTFVVIHLPSCNITLCIWYRVVWGGSSSYIHVHVRTCICVYIYMYIHVYK